MSKDCVQWSIDCDTDTNASNCLNGINTAISAFTSGWQNDRNKNSNVKEFNHFNNKYTVNGIQRLGDSTEKNTLINKIRGMGSPPFITGFVQYHFCNHDEDNSPCVISERWDF